jgi:hypothetical protein
MFPGLLYGLWVMMGFASRGGLWVLNQPVLLTSPLVRCVSVVLRLSIKPLGGLTESHFLQRCRFVYESPPYEVSC